MNAWTSYSDLLDGLRPSAEPIAIDVGSRAAQIRIVGTPRRCCSAVLATAVASALLCHAAWGAPGDLDPTFGDVGRFLPAVAGPVWALEALGDDAALFGGGEYYCYYGCDIHGYVGQLLAAGAQDPGFDAAGLVGIQVLDLTVQADKKIVGVGIAGPANDPGLAVFRLLPSGALDAGFATGGVLSLSDDDAGRSVVLDPDGHIVVAGTRGGNLVVIRLNVDGTLDMSFGTNGVFVGPTAASEGTMPRIARSSTGQYRIALNDPGCSVIGLTASGTIDAAFGSGGVAPADPAAPDTATCSALTLLPDDKVLVGGSTDGHGFVRRLLATGATDATFSGVDVADRMSAATALGVATGGSILVAGLSRDEPTATLVARLSSNGAVDPGYGVAGVTQIALPQNCSYCGGQPIVNDLKILSGGRVLLAGGGYANFGSLGFTARLVGDGGSGPGVLHVKDLGVAATEAAGEARVTVQRVGGGSGAVSVAYEAVGGGSGQPLTAEAGSDFTAPAGRLDWASGDRSDREIVVPILANASPFEEEESLEVRLSDPQGGAGLGRSAGTIAIRGDGYPAGVISAAPLVTSVIEGNVPIQYRVSRRTYGNGAVSVTLATSGGSATAGVDYTPTSVTLTWADGDMSDKLVNVQVIGDKKNEDDETVQVALSAATGGAVIDPQPTAAVTIRDNDTSGGGGQFEGLAAMLLGLAGLLRRVRQAR